MIWTCSECGRRTLDVMPRLDLPGHPILCRLHAALAAAASRTTNHT